MKIVPVPAVQKPNNDLQKELDFIRNLAKRKTPCKQSSTVVHLNEHKIKIGYEELGRVPKMTHARVLEHIEFLKTL